MEETRHYNMCPNCFEMHVDSCPVCEECQLCCQCATTMGELDERKATYDQLVREMQLVAKVQAKGTKEIDRDLAFKLYISGYLDRETPFEVVFMNTPGFYLWCSRDYQRLSWCTITG